MGRVGLYGRPSPGDSRDRLWGCPARHLSSEAPFVILSAAKDLSLDIAQILRRVSSESCPERSKGAAKGTPMGIAPLDTHLSTRPCIVGARLALALESMRR